MLSSPRCGGYSNGSWNVPPFIYFLPRVAGVIPLIQFTKISTMKSFLPRVAGVTPASQANTSNVKLSSPRCGGISLCWIFVRIKKSIPYPIQNLTGVYYRFFCRFFSQNYTIISCEIKTNIYICYIRKRAPPTIKMEGIRP